MMGYGHVASVTAVAVWAAEALHAVADDVRRAPIIAGGMIGSLIPDADHPNSTFAHMWGGLSEGMATVVSVVAKGHRGATHDPVTMTIATGVLFAMTSFGLWTPAAKLLTDLCLSVPEFAHAHATVTPYLPWLNPAMNVASWAVLAGVLIAAVARLGNRNIHPSLNFTASCVTAIYANTNHWNVAALAAPVAVGALLHIAGDKVKIGSKQELAIVVTSYTAIAAWLGYHLFH